MKRKDLFILSAYHVQNILIRAISNTIDLMFHLNVLIFNKSKGTRHEY